MQLFYGKRNHEIIKYTTYLPGITNYKNRYQNIFSATAYVGENMNGYIILANKFKIVKFIVPWSEDQALEQDQHFFFDKQFPVQLVSHLTLSRKQDKIIKDY